MLFSFFNKSLPFCCLLIIIYDNIKQYNKNAPIGAQGEYMRTFNFNRGWHFAAKFEEKFIEGDFGDCSFIDVEIPHNVKDVPYNYFDEESYQFVSCYYKQFYADKEWQGKACILKFEAVAHYAEVYVNGKFALSHSGGYTSFETDIEPYLIYGEENLIVVKVDSTERNDIPPFGNVIDYLCYGGIYREVSLAILEKSYIKHARISSYDTLKSPKIGIKLDFSSPALKDVECVIKNADDVTVSTFVIPSNGESYVEYKKPIANPTLWSIENPYLYTVELIYNGDLYHYRMGFRDVKFTKNSFYLNGIKTKIIGLNRHQSYPYVGYAMPRSAQIADAEYLKDLGVNLVRTSHYPNSKHFLNRCDELGLMVFTEIPGWQHVSKREDWRENCINSVSEMIYDDYNHPSIIIWGVRINESGDDNELYTKTNAVAHKLDDTRQTGGVRCIPQSNLLEDVYTFNDFIHSGGKRALTPKFIVCGNKPLLITEHNGHMFPTKRYDHEKKRQEHMLRHARVINATFKSKNTSGCIGWCMSDYNTHKDFGSGDKICYHGVSDMFRIDKLAAKLYRAQQDRYPVLEVSSNMEIGDVAGGQVGDVYMITNCEKVNLYKNGVLINTFEISKLAKKSNLKHMTHPPIALDDIIGTQIEKDNQFKLSPHACKRLKKFLLAIKKYGTIPAVIRMPLTVLGLMIRYGIGIEDFTNLFGKYATSWGDKSAGYTFEGFKNNETVKCEKSAAQCAVLKISADSTKLVENETYDVTRVEVNAISHCGTPLPYCNETFNVQTSDNIEVIGDTECALIGGARAFWIKTVGKTGKATVTVSSKIGQVALELDIDKKNILEL